VSTPHRRKDPAQLSRRIERSKLRMLRRLVPESEILNREYLCRMYLDEERDICAIARDAGCTPSSVVFHLVAYGIPMRPAAIRRIGPAGRRPRQPRRS
jgi:hypothetical protein